MLNLKNVTSKLHIMSASIAFIQKTLFVDLIGKFAVIKGQLFNEVDSSAVSPKLMKNHLTKHVQDLYGLSVQYNDFKSVLYSNTGIVLGNTLINIAQLLLSKRCYNQKIVNSIRQKKKPSNTN